jgi:hypothetical protein
MEALIDIIVVLVMIAPLGFFAYKIGKNEEMETPSKVGWIAMIIVFNYAGLIVYLFFRQHLRSALSTMAYDKKIELDEKWKD